MHIGLDKRKHLNMERLALVQREADSRGGKTESAEVKDTHNTHNTHIQKQAKVCANPI